MSGRLNNLSARLLVNEWLRSIGQACLSADLSYTDFATELRKIVAPKQHQVPFTSRSDAVAYIRSTSRQRVPEQTAAP